jgi:uncharacterized membrane protein YdfJ with MMPL/SSD domain
VLLAITAVMTAISLLANPGHILSRIRELRVRGAATREALTGGIASSAGVVTSAAVIMRAVFSIFTSLHVLELKMLGIGLPAAILIDATIVRGILVPAAMAVLGERCWYLPRWLCWLPGSGTAAAAPGSASRAGRGLPAGGHAGVQVVQRAGGGE